MAGVNQYRRRWSTQYPRRRSPSATIGRLLPIVAVAAVLAVTLYIFGVVGPDTGRHRAVPTVAATLVPPPAPLVVPPAKGNIEPFGPLPPLVPLAQDDPRPTLNYALSGPLTGGAPRADVFSIAWRSPTAGQVDTLARQLGLTGPVKQPKAGLYTVDGNGQLSVDGKATVYAPPPTAAATNTLPDDRNAISAARTWLATHSMLPPDVGNADVRRNGDTLDVVFHPKTLPDILSDQPGIRVRMGPGSVVLEVQRAWPSELLPGAYDLLSLDEAWQQAPERGAVRTHAPPGVVVPPNANALINNVSFAYALGTDKNGKDYLLPVYVFSGTVTIPGQRAGADITLAVPAVKNLQQSAG